MSNAASAHRRKTSGHTPCTTYQSMGTATQERPGGQSRRSNTRQDKRTHARRRPSTRPKLRRRSRPKSAPAAKPPLQHPSGQTHPRKTKGPGVRVRQDNPTHAGPRAKQPAPGSGEPRKRLKLRSAMHNYVSCLGMTTQKVSASKRFHRTQRRQKALFFGAYPVSFGKTKETGYSFRSAF